MVPRKPFAPLVSGILFISWKFYLPSLKLTLSPLKMDGWNTILSYWVSAHFQGREMFVSGRGYKCVSLYLPTGRQADLSHISGSYWQREKPETLLLSAGHWDGRVGGVWKRSEVQMFSFCWWFRNPAITGWNGSLSPLFAGFDTCQVVQHFLTSTVSLWDCKKGTRDGHVNWKNSMLI